MKRVAFDFANSVSLSLLKGKKNDAYDSSSVTYL